ncbi:MAG: cardiolipin synthase [Peptococcia bacterium]|jgi:cardiolipin synthase
MKKREFLLCLIILLLLSIGYFYLSVVYVDIFNLSLSPVKGYIKTGNVVYFIFSSMVFFAGLLLLLERRDPSKTLAWLLILLFLPLVGFILYLVFGRHPRKQRITRKKKVLNNNLYPLQQSLYQNPLPGNTEAREKARLIELIYNNADFPPTANNEIQVLTDGQEIFPAFIEAIKKAQKHIHLETYILRDDNIGNTIADLLCAKAQKGVKVRLIYDGLGSRHLGKEYLEKLRTAGVEVAVFFPVKLPFLHRKINYRNHRKILVVDGITGFVGGANIGDEYLGQNPEIGYWRDTHVCLKGNAVYFLQRIFLQDWHFITGKSLEHNSIDLFPKQKTTGKHIVQITASGPDSQWEAIMQVYYYTIATAEKSVYITSPYFIPNESILTALKTAALSGVDVKLILPAKPDHKVVFWAAMSYLGELLEAGVEIYFYHKGFIHSKVLTVDGIVSSIGSANMDQRSFSLNFEVNAFIYDQETALRLEQDFQEDLRHAKKLTLEELQNRSLGQHFIESIARLFSPLL